MQAIKQGREKEQEEIIPPIKFNRQSVTKEKTVKQRIEKALGEVEQRGDGNIKKVYMCK